MNSCRRLPPSSCSALWRSRHWRRLYCTARRWRAWASSAPSSRRSWSRPKSRIIGRSISMLPSSPPLPLRWRVRGCGPGSPSRRLCLVRCGLFRELTPSRSRRSARTFSMRSPVSSLPPYSSSVVWYTAHRPNPARSIGSQRWRRRFISWSRRSWFWQAGTIPSRSRHSWFSPPRQWQSPGARKRLRAQCRSLQSSR
jgi:hypothetical protein